MYMINEKRFQLMLENTHDIVFHTVDGLVEWISPSVFTVTGWEPAELLGPSNGHLWHPEDRELSFSLLNSSYKGGSGHATLRFQKKDGTYIWLELNVQPYSEEDGRFSAVGIMRDVTDRTISQQALIASEQRFRLLAEHASDIVAHTDLDSIVQWISPSVKNILGWHPEELVGSCATDLLHSEDLKERVDSVANGSLENSTSFEARYASADGTYQWFSITIRPIYDEQGKLIGRVSAARDISTERKARESLEFQAFHDSLTGLRNRTWIMDTLGADLQEAKKNGSTVALLYIDLDQFKVVNDSLGHDAGDQMLMNIAQRMKSIMGEQDRLGRSGGDAFMIVLPGINSALEVEQFAEQLSQVVAAEQIIHDRRVVMTISIGISLSRLDSTPETLLREADSALYRAKDAGRNQWHFFENRMHVDAMSRFDIEEELRNALTNDEFRVRYQPIVELADSQIVGHEVLLRWEHPTRGLLAPGDFLAVAEASGLIIEIGRQVLDKVCEMLITNPLMPGPVSINISAVELTKGNWLSGFKSTLARYQVDPKRIIVELTETALFELDKSTLEILKDLPALGVGLHLDDFGTGFSSISLLRDLPVTGIKLDRRFVNDLSLTDNPSDALAAGLAGLASGLRLIGIAEGIETVEQAELLRSIGWEHGQGYHFGRPASEPLRN